MRTLLWAPLAGIFGACGGSEGVAMAATLNGGPASTTMLENDPLRNYVLAPEQPAAMTGPSNVGLGQSVLLSLKEGSDNVAVGDEALFSLRDGKNCVAIGSRALQLADSVVDCTAVGADALASATSGVGGTAVGRFAAQSMSDAGNNTAIGDSALRFSATGIANVAVGYTSGQANVDGSYNTLVGALAGRTMPGGEQNVIVGAHAMAETSLASSGNVVIGAFCMQQAVGSNNVALGNHAADALETGSRNVFVGGMAGAVPGQKPDSENVVVIGYGAHAGNDHMVAIGNDETQHFSLGGVMFTKTELQALLTLVRGSTT